MRNEDALAGRVRPILSQHKGFSEKKMFGGVWFHDQREHVRGRLEGIAYRAARQRTSRRDLAKPHTKPFDITGRVMKGWALVDPSGIESTRI